MLTDHARLMQFFVAANKVDGRKKLQKMIYILQKCGAPFQEKYQFHFYGPYSEELSLRIEELCNLGFITEETETKSNYTRYHYEITNDGGEFLRQFPTSMPDMTGSVELMKQQSSRFLELASTILYFAELPAGDVADKVRTVKPKQYYTDEEMDDAFRFISEIRALS